MYIDVLYVLVNVPFTLLHYGHKQYINWFVVHIQSSFEFAESLSLLKNASSRSYYLKCVQA